MIYRNGETVKVDNAKSTALFQKASDQGDALGTAHLAEQYDFGFGVVPDPKKAAELYTRALNQGIGNDDQEAAARTNLGTLYLHGDGVPRDYAKALHYYQLAGDKGYDTALYNLGIVYDQGFGVAKDAAKAAEYYRKAADKGNLDAMVNLASLYYNGEGVKQDRAKALDLMKKAADQGSGSARQNLQIMTAS